MQPAHIASPRTRRASVLLEVALVLPLLLMVIFATIEFGYAFYIKHTLSGAAREGARRAIISTATDADVQAAVEQAIEAGGLGNTSYRIAILDGRTGTPAAVDSIPVGSSVIVEVRAGWSQYSVFLSGFGDWIDGDLTGRTSMRRER